MREVSARSFRLPVVVALSITLAACGGSSKHRSAPPPRRSSSAIEIYSSLPLHGLSGADGRSLVEGIELALDQANDRAGRWTINYISLDDSTSSSSTWDRGQTANNARRAALDPRAVLYIGEFDSDASELSIPILNEAGVPQVSPANRYVGLTTDDPGSIPGEPQKYYPAGLRTFLRIMPRDTVQAAAALQAMRQAGCSRVAIANDGGPYGTELADLLEASKGLYGITVTSNTTINPAASSDRSYAGSVKRQGANCFYFAGLVSGGAVQVTKDIHAALPSARIFVGDRACVPAYTSPKAGGVPAAIDPLIECTLPQLKLSAYPGGRSFLAAFRARYGGATPGPYAIYGYEVMKLALETIKGLGNAGDSKSALRAALFSTTARHGAIGTYGFDRNGDTTLRSYGLYRVGPDGAPAFSRTLTPGSVL